MSYPSEQLPDKHEMRLFRWADYLGVLFALCVFLVVMAVMVMYAHKGESWVNTLGLRLGEVGLENGQQYQAAGEYDQAIDAYKQALNAKFALRKNRTFTLIKLGTLLMWRTSHEAALPYLEEAARDPEAPLSVFEYLCDCLITAKQYAKVHEAVRQWDSAAARARQTASQAQAKYYDGEAYRAEGNDPQALASYLAGNDIQPGGLNAYEAAQLLHKNGQLDKALELLELYLPGGSGGRAEYARYLRNQILAAKAIQPNAGSNGATP